jgi:hypothetical protein
MLLVPLAILMIVPMSLSTHAVISNEYGMYVKCNNNSGLSETDTITLTFLGHTVTTTCLGEDDAIHQVTVDFFSNAGGYFHMTATTAGTSHSASGFFLSNRYCSENGIEGIVYSPSHRSYVEWELYAACVL